MRPSRSFSLPPSPHWQPSNPAPHTRTSNANTPRQQKWCHTHTHTQCAGPRPHQPMPCRPPPTSSVTGVSQVACAQVGPGDGGESGRAIEQGRGGVLREDSDPVCKVRTVAQQHAVLDVRNLGRSLLLPLPLHLKEVHKLQLVLGVGFGVGLLQVRLDQLETPPSLPTALMRVRSLA